MPLIGAGYRFEVHARMVEQRAAFDVLEVMVDHYLAADDAGRALIDSLTGQMPVGTHGLGLSLGTAAPPDGRYLEAVARTLTALGARYYSEHLAFTRAGAIQFEDLMPVPRTAEAAEHLIRNVAAVRAAIDVPFYLENIAYYFEYRDDEFDEAAFLNLICRETGAGVLLDVENLYANQINHGIDAVAFIDALAPGSVKALHIAGGGWYRGVFVDDHGHAPPDGALELMSYALGRHDPEVVIVERDKNLGDGAVLIADVGRVRACATLSAGATASGRVVHEAVSR